MECWVAVSFRLDKIVAILNMNSHDHLPYKTLNKARLLKFTNGGREKSHKAQEAPPSHRISKQFKSSELLGNIPTHYESHSFSQGIPHCG